MAVAQLSPEKFLLCRSEFTDHDNQFVDVTEHDSCIEALELAMSWYGERMAQGGRDVEVWVGPYCIFDSSEDFDGRHLPDRSTAPEAPGRYVWELTDAQSGDGRYVLIGPAVPAPAEPPSPPGRSGSDGQPARAGVEPAADRA